MAHVREACLEGLAVGGASSLHMNTHHPGKAAQAFLSEGSMLTALSRSLAAAP